MANLYNSLIIWYRNAISPDFWNSWEKWEIQRVSLGLCGDPSLPVCSLSQAREWEDLTQHSSPHTMQPILKPPLVYALLIKGAAKSPTKPSPSPHTHPHTNTTNHAKKLELLRLEGPLEKEGSLGVGWDNYRKEKKKREREEKTSTKSIALNSIGCTSCCGPVTHSVPALPPSLPPSHSGNYDSYYRGKGEQGRKLGEEHRDTEREGLSLMRGLHILVHQCWTERHKTLMEIYSPKPSKIFDYTFFFPPTPICAQRSTGIVLNFLSNT